jgi:hypothetical protein
MLGQRSPLLGMFSADRHYLGMVGEGSFHGFLARHVRELFRDEDFASLLCGLGAVRGPDPRERPGNAGFRHAVADQSRTPALCAESLVVKIRAALRRMGTGREQRHGLPPGRRPPGRPCGCMRQWAVVQARKEKAR